MRAIAARAGLVLGLVRVEVGVERDLRVHDDLLAARQTDDQVGAEQAAVGVPGRRLQDEVAMLDEAGGLDDVTQPDLAPPSADVRARAARS